MSRGKKNANKAADSSTNNQAEMAATTTKTREKMIDEQELELKLAQMAIVDTFTERYGKDIEKIEALQALCEDVGVEVGPTITQCKKNLKVTYINIANFVEDVNEGKPIRTFGSYKALRKYITKKGPAKQIPLYLAKENPVLRFMLIKLH